MVSQLLTDRPHDLSIVAQDVCGPLSEPLPDGIALAAIQGLYDILNEKNQEIETLRAEKDADIAALRARLERLEAMLADTTDKESRGG